MTTYIDISAIGAKLPVIGRKGSSSDISSSDSEAVIVSSIRATTLAVDLVATVITKCIHFMRKMENCYVGMNDMKSNEKYRYEVTINIS